MSRLDNQYFTYRQNPVDYDGTGTIESLKGSTLVWNQLANIIATSGTTNGVTFTVNVDGITLNGTATSTIIYPITSTSGVFKGGHKYLFRGIPSGTTADTHRLDLRLSADGSVANADIKNNAIVNPRNDLNAYLTIRVQSGTTVSNVKYSVQIFDLTLMGFNTAEEFTTLFNLPYYQYDTGSLLSFMGEQIKTTGKNLLEPPTSGSVSGVTFTVNNDGSITVNGTATSNGTYDFYRSTTALPSWAKLGQTYTLSLTNAINRLDIFSYDSSGAITNLVSTSGYVTRVFTIPNDAVGMLARIFITSGVTYGVTIYPQIEIGTSASAYESYQEDILSLPTQQYFPWGMDGVGTVYDELTQTGYVKRFGAVDLGNLQWTYDSTYTRFYAIIPNMKNGERDVPINAKIPNYTVYTNDAAWDGRYDKSYWGSTNRLYIVNKAYTSASSFASAIKGTYMRYELATPLENYGVVDLGSLTWIKTGTRFEATISDMVVKPNTWNTNFVLSNGIVYNSAISGLNPSVDCCGSYSSNKFLIRIAEYENYQPSTFQYYMEGVYLLYEKQNPTPIDLDLTYNIYKDGTEQLYPYITIDLGDLDWTAEGSGLGGDYEMTSRSVPFGIDIPSMFSKADISCSAYTTRPYVEVNTGTTGISVNEDGKIVVYDPNYNQFGSASAFKTAMSGVKLTYRIFTTPFYGDIYYRGLIPVSVNVYPLGSGTVTGSGQYRYHEDVTLVATPNDIYRFLRYEDENGDTLSTSPTYTFEVGE